MTDYLVLNSSKLPSIVYGLLLAGDLSVGTPFTNLMNLLNTELATANGFYPGGKAAGACC